MNYNQIVLFSSTILLAAIIAVIKFNKIDRSFYPFLILTWVASLNEITSLIVSMLGYSTVLNNNIYVLAEALLILWQFRKWNLFSSYTNTCRLINITLILVWILENYNIAALGKLTMHFRLLYSMIIVMLSIQLNTSLVFNYKKNLVASPVFLICSGFTIFFTYKILIEVFWMYGLNTSVSFRNNVYIILIWINGLINILYSVAILCIPAKPRYIKLS